MNYFYTGRTADKHLVKKTEILPHRGLPPCRGGGADAPMTRTILNLKERS